MTKKQAVKAFMKSNDRLFVQREKDNVLLSNRYMILTVPYWDYKLEVVPASGLFKDIKDGEKFEILQNNINPSTVDFSRFFNDSEYNTLAIETPFLTDWQTINNALYRLFISNDKALIYINNSYLEICKAFHEKMAFYSKPGDKGKISGIVDFDNKCFILPIRCNAPYSVTFEMLERA